MSVTAVAGDFLLVVPASEWQFLVGKGKEKICFMDEGMFYSNLNGSYFWTTSWLEVWAYNQIKMREFSTVFVASLNCPCQIGLFTKYYPRLHESGKHLG